MLNVYNYINCNVEIKDYSLKNSSIYKIGTTAEIYKTSQDRLLKLFFKDFNQNFALSEYLMSKKISNLNINVPKAYDVVKVNDRYGVILENIDGINLCEIISQNIDNFESYIEKYYQMLNCIHSKKVTCNNIFSAKDVMLDKVDAVDKYFLKSEIDEIKKVINDIEDSNHLLHGDPNITNFIIKDNQWYLIDLASTTKGDKIFDIAAIHACSVDFCKFTGIGDDGHYNFPDGFLLKIMDQLLGYYNLDKKSLRTMHILSCLLLINMFDNFFDIELGEFNLNKDDVMNKGCDILLNHL